MEKGFYIYPHAYLKGAELKQYNENIDRMSDPDINVNDKTDLKGAELKQYNENINSKVD